MTPEHDVLAAIGHDRVRERTGQGPRERIDRELRDRARQISQQSPEALGRRLAELDREWDLDRALMANFAIVGGFTFMTGLRQQLARRSLLRRRPAMNPWLTFFSSQLGFLMLHALAGWCPPSIVFRRLGIRTSREIAAERYAVLDALQRRAAEAH